MALSLTQNLDLQSKTPNFARDQFKTLAAMKAYPETSLPEGHLAYCLETQETYQYKSANTADATTGKWRVFAPAASVTPATIRGTRALADGAAEVGGKLFDFTSDDSYIRAVGTGYTQEQLSAASEKLYADGVAEMAYEGAAGCAMKILFPSSYGEPLLVASNDASTTTVYKYGGGGTITAKHTFKHRIFDLLVALDSLPETADSLTALTARVAALEKAGSAATYE